MYLKITNKGEVSRKFYELIGASNKRDRMDDPTVIGNKGSGAKLAVIPILRLGLELAISSTDSEGQYILSYTTQKIDLGTKDPLHQIFFKYNGNGEFPSQLTTEVFQDWDNPIGNDNMKVFKALREYLVNAWDEDKDFTIEEVETICQTESKTTSVFITITDEIRQILDSLPKYFKILNECKPLFSAPSEMFGFKGGDIYPKSDPKATRLFSQGVMVDCNTHSIYSSIFDYSLDSKYLLSEERIIKNFSDFENQIGQLLMKLDDFTIINLLFKAMVKSEANLELDAINRIKNPPSNIVEHFKEAWKLFFGKKAVLGTGTLQTDGDAKNFGYTVVGNLPYQLVNFLKRCGVATSSNVVPKVSIKKVDKPELETIELNKEQQERFDEAYKRFLRYFPEASCLPIHFYRPLDWRWQGKGGHCGVGAKQFKEIWIAEDSLNSVEKILNVLVHEGRHCLTQAGDYDRKFTQVADEQIVEMMLADTTPPRKNEWRAQVVNSRGILIPKRFINQPVHVFVFEDEIRFKIGADTFLTTKLEKSITSHVSQKRKVTSFRNFGCVFLPPTITSQLPNEVCMELN